MQREQARTRTGLPSRWITVGCRFGSQRRRARLRFMPIDWGFQPVIGFLPQMSQARAMGVSSLQSRRNRRARTGAAGAAAMVARYDPAMQSGPAPRRSSRELDEADLDRPIRQAFPDLARAAAVLARLEIRTPREALFHLPFRYDDFSDLRALGDLVADEKQSARVRVEAVRVEPGFRRRPHRGIAQLVDDAGGSAEAVWVGRRVVESRIRP